jgi:spore germination protein YaaH
VFGFLPYWELATAVPAIDFDQLTTLAWFGVEANPRGRLVRRAADGSTPGGWAGWESETFRDLMSRAQAMGIRVVLTIERFSWSASQRRRTLTLLECAPYRRALARNIVAEVMERGADGVNLDFEPLPDEVSDEFTSFVRDLRARLDEARAGMQLTFDVTADVSAYDLPALVADDAADAVLLMGYDYRVASASRTGSISPVDNPGGPDLRESLDNLLAVAPADWVILGLPWYGRAWSARGPAAHAPTRRGSRLPGSVAAWYDDSLLVALEGGRNFDPVEVSAWTAYVRQACERCPQTWRQLWYDDVDSFRHKVELALDLGLRGIGIWALGYSGELPDLWTALALAHGRISDAMPPTGSATLDPGSVRGRRGGLPVVRNVVALDLSARDDPDGTGLAFVRLSNGPEIADDGALSNGVTYPAAERVSWSLITGSTLRPPKGSRQPARTAASSRPGRRTIHVQWRDIAGNWSEPRQIAVWHRPGGGSAPIPTPSPSPAPSEPPTSSTPSPSPAPTPSPAPSEPAVP